MELRKIPFIRQRFLKTLWQKDSRLTQKEQAALLFSKIKRRVRHRPEQNALHRGKCVRWKKKYIKPTLSTVADNNTRKSILTSCWANKAPLSAQCVAKYI